MTVKNHHQFYEDPELYDKILGGHDPGEPEYYKKLASKSKNLLFLGPGTGRILKELCRPDCRVVGVEKSKKMAEKCQKYIAQAKIINRDVLKLNLKEKFDLIIAPYEFLNHFDPKQLAQVLKIVSKHLQKDGTFVAQLKNPHHCVSRIHQSELDCVELIDDKILEKSYVTYNEGQQTYTDIIERVFLNGGKVDVVTMNWYYYFLDRIKNLYLTAGLKLTKVKGDFNGAKFTKTSTLLIIESRKL